MQEVDSRQKNLRRSEERRKLMLGRLWSWFILMGVVVLIVLWGVRYCNDQESVLWIINATDEVDLQSRVEPSFAAHQEKERYPFTFLYWNVKNYRVGVKSEESCQQVAEMIRKENPDIVGLVEMGGGFCSK